MNCYIFILLLTEAVRKKQWRHDESPFMLQSHASYQIGANLQNSSSLRARGSLRPWQNRRPQQSVRWLHAYCFAGTSTSAEYSSKAADWNRTTEVCSAAHTGSSLASLSTRIQVVYVDVRRCAWYRTWLPHWFVSSVWRCATAIRFLWGLRRSIQSMTQKLFRFSGPRAWNSGNVRDASSRIVFANKLETHLFKLHILDMYNVFINWLMNFCKRRWVLDILHLASEGWLINWKKSPSVTFIMQYNFRMRGASDHVLEKKWCCSKFNCILLFKTCEYSWFSARVTIWRQEIEPYRAKRQWFAFPPQEDLRPHCTSCPDDTQANYDLRFKRTYSWDIIKHVQWQYYDEICS